MKPDFDRHLIRWFVAALDQKIRTHARIRAVRDCIGQTVPGAL